MFVQQTVLKGNNRFLNIYLPTLRGHSKTMLTFFCPIGSIIPGSLENSGEDCWNGCNYQGGKCDWCGIDGWCCRQGVIGNGCDGTFGGETSHRCVLKPGNM